MAAWCGTRGHPCPGRAASPECRVKIVAETLRLLDADGTITVARFRDRFGSSRKYALAVLEHFDRLHLTRRVGDERVRGHAART